MTRINYQKGHFYLKMEVWDGGGGVYEGRGGGIYGGGGGQNRISLAH